MPTVISICTSASVRHYLPNRRGKKKEIINNVQVKIYFKIWQKRTDGERDLDLLLLRLLPGLALVSRCWGGCLAWTFEILEDLHSHLYHLRPRLIVKIELAKIKSYNLIGNQLHIGTREDQWQNSSNKSSFYS